METNLELLSTTMKNDKVVAKVRAKTINDAMSFFKGRFGMYGVLVKTNTRTIFTIMQKY